MWCTEERYNCESRRDVACMSYRYNNSVADSLHKGRPFRGSIRISSDSYSVRVARELHPGDFGARGISARHYSRNIGAPLEATGFLNWVSKDVTLRWKRDAITGTASYCDSSRGYGVDREWGKVKRVVSRHLGTPCRLAEGTNGESTP